MDFSSRNCIRSWRSASLLWFLLIAYTVLIHQDINPPGNFEIGVHFCGVQCIQILAFWYSLTLQQEFIKFTKAICISKPQWWPLLYFFPIWGQYCMMVTIGSLQKSFCMLINSIVKQLDAILDQLSSISSWKFLSVLSVFLWPSQTLSLQLLQTLP